MGNTLLRPSLGIFWGSEYGAGIGSCLATVAMIDCTVVSNTVTCSAWDGASLGGGIGIREGAWSVQRSVVAFNAAAGNTRSHNYGAGMLIDGGTHRFANLLLASNRCNKVGSQFIRAYVGDGAYLLNGARVSFENVSVAHNEGQGIFSEWAGTYPPDASGRRAPAQRQPRQPGGLWRDGAGLAQPRAGERAAGAVRRVR